MATSSRDDLRRSVETIIADRHAVQARERALVTALNDALKGLGYEIVSTAPRAAVGRLLGAVAKRRRASRSRTAKRARPRPSATGARARKGE